MAQMPDRFLQHTAIKSIFIPVEITTLSFACFCQCRFLTNINYEGTINEWNNITKKTYWNYDVPATVVHCADGDITL